MSEAGKTNAVYILRQVVPEGHSSKGCASFKQVKPRPWRADVIPGVSVVGLVTHKVLCQVVWGTVINNFMQHKTIRGNCS